MSDHEKQLTALIHFDPRALTLRNGPVDELKLKRMARKKTTPPPIVVFPDKDTTLYVADGTHRTTLAQQQGRPVSGVIIEDENFLIGSQTILDRVIGIHFLRGRR